MSSFDPLFSKPVQPGRTAARLDERTVRPDGPADGPDPKRRRGAFLPAAPGRSGRAFLRRPGLIAGGTLALSLLLTGCGAQAGAPQPQGGPGGQAGGAPGGGSAPAPAGSLRLTDVTGRWMSIHPAQKTVDLRIEAAIGGHFNFNGYSNGFLTVTVPRGWTVRASFINRQQGLPMSAMIVPLSELTAGGRFTPAFPGAFTPSPFSGTRPGVSQAFSFRAARSGRFALVCAVPGYAQSGMWDYFTVSPSTSRPFATVK